MQVANVRKLIDGLRWDRRRNPYSGRREYSQRAQAVAGARVTEDGMRWQPTWTQAMTDFRGDDEEQPFADVTVRMTVPASIGGSHVRAELSNRFGDEPVLIGRGAISAGDRSLDIAFEGQRSTEIPVGESRRTDPIDLTIRHGDDVGVDLYLPELTPYATANGFRTRA